MAHGSKNGMTRGRLIFICVWLTIFAVAFGLWALYLGSLGTALEEYELRRPENAVQAVFDKHFADADTRELAKYSDFASSPFFNADIASAYLDSLYEKGIDYRVLEMNDDAVRCEVYSGDTVFAEFSAIRDGASDAVFGAHAWKLGEVILINIPTK